MFRKVWSLNAILSYLTNSNRLVSTTAHNSCIWDCLSPLSVYMYSCLGVDSLLFLCNALPGLPHVLCLSHLSCSRKMLYWRPFCFQRWGITVLPSYCVHSAMVWAFVGILWPAPDEGHIHLYRAFKWSLHHRGLLVGHSRVWTKPEHSGTDEKIK